jgi:hypothetical protein
MFSRAPAFETMTTDFSRNVTPATVATLRADVADLKAAGTELQTTGLTTLAHLLKMTPEQFNTAVQQQFPALASGVQTLPATADNFERLLATIASQDAHLKSAVAIPSKSMSTTWIPWLILGAGIVAVGAGLTMSMRWSAWLAIALGALMIAGIFAFSLPSKTRDSDALNQAIRPYFTQAQITQARTAMNGINATAQELINKVLPAVATAQHLPPSQLTGTFASQFPTLTRAIIALPDATDKFNALTNTFERNLSNFKKVEPFHFQAATWSLAVVGLLILLTGAIPLVWLDEASAAERAARRMHKAA